MRSMSIQKALEQIRAISSVSHPRISNQGQYFEDVARLVRGRSIRRGGVPQGGFRNRFSSKSSSYQIMLSPASLCRLNNNIGYLLTILNVVVVGVEDSRSGIRLVLLEVRGRRVQP